jgi:hypothetical protein
VPVCSGGVRRTVERVRRPIGGKQSIRSAFFDFKRAGRSSAEFSKSWRLLLSSLYDGPAEMAWEEPNRCIGGNQSDVPVFSQPKVPDRAVGRANPDQANGRANTQRPAIGMNAAPPYVPYRKPETRVSSAVTSPEPNA